jgi:hypothetical protein
MTRRVVTKNCKKSKNTTKYSKIERAGVTLPPDLVVNGKKGCKLENTTLIPLIVIRRKRP